MKNQCKHHWKTRGNGLQQGFPSQSRIVSLPSVLLGLAVCLLFETQSLYTEYVDFEHVVPDLSFPALGVQAV